MNPLVDQIKIMKSNRFYRMADLILRKGLRWRSDREEILENPKYCNSFLFDCFKNLKNPKIDSVPDNILKEVTHRHRLKHAIKEEQDTLVINLRCGDVVLTETGKVDRFGGQHIFRPGKLIKEINHYTDKNNNISKILIVATMHFGDNEIHDLWRYSEEAFQKNRKLLSFLFEKITLECKMNLELIEQKECDIENIDYHFLT